MAGRHRDTRSSRRRAAWLALALVPLLTGCLGAVALPLVAGGTLMAREKLRVRAATRVPKGRESGSRPKVVLTTLKEMPPPSDPQAVAAASAWQMFFGYALASGPPKDSAVGGARSALLAQPPSMVAPAPLQCTAPTPAVIIDLDEQGTPFAPERLAPAQPEIAQGLARLRQAGIVVLWISRLSAASAAQVAQALRASGLDPQGQDQLLLVRNAEDRKQLLRQDAQKDVCVVAIAGDTRADFDELFDYLRDPDGALGLESMIGKGWFLLPSLETPAAR